MLDSKPDPKGRWRTVLPDGLTVEGLIALYHPGGVPPVLCKGLCYDQCTMIPVTPGEKDRVEVATGRKLYVTSEGFCSMLNSENRCDAYSVRPRVCRMYGAAEGLVCPHGCSTLTGQYLRHVEGIAYLLEAVDVEGWPEPTDVGHLS